MSESPKPPSAPVPPPVREVKAVSRNAEEHWAALGMTFFVLSVIGVFLAPGLVVVLAFLVTPALIRSVVVGLRSKKPEPPGQLGRIVNLFFASVGMMVLVGMAAGAAFCAVCFVVGCAEYSHTGKSWLTDAPWVGISAGAVAGSAMAIFLLILLWFPRKARHE